MVKLTILLMFVSGTHFEKTYEYASMQQCQLEGSKAEALIEAGYKKSRDVDVRFVCEGVK